MKKKILLALVMSLLTVVQTSVCQSLTDLLPEDTRSDINKTISEALNGLVIFSSSSSLGSGYFTFDSKDSPDTKLNVTRLMGDMRLGDDNNSFVPIVRGGIGGLTLSEQILPFEGEGANDFSRIKTLSASLGAGIEAVISEGLVIMPTFDLVYSHTENRYDYNNPFSQYILQSFDKDLFNWDIDTMSYNPGINLRYTESIDSVAITPMVTYTHAFVDSFWTNSKLLDVNTSSGILNSKIKAEIPSNIHFGNANVVLIPQFARTDIYRDARSGIGFGHFYEASLALMAKDQTILPLFKDFGISGGYSFTDDFSGYRIGVEAEL